MAWLRIDDKFANHPKLLALSDREFRIWMRLLCWAAAQRSGSVPHVIRRIIPGLTKAKLEHFATLGLLDADGDDYSIHDWATYNPRDPAAADRMKQVRHRAPQPRGTGWEQTRAEVFARDRGICVDCGEFDERWNADHEPHREVLLERGDSIYDLTFIFTRCHSCHARKTRREALSRQANTVRTPTERESEPEPNTSERGSPPRAQPHARVPSRPQDQEPSVLPSEASNAADAEPQLAATNGRKDGTLERLTPTSELERARGGHT